MWSAAAVKCSPTMARLGGVGLGSGLTGKLGLAWVVVAGLSRMLGEISVSISPYGVIMIRYGCMISTL